MLATVPHLTRRMASVFAAASQTCLGAVGGGEGPEAEAGLQRAGRGGRAERVTAEGSPRYPCSCCRISWMTRSPLPTPPHPTHPHHHHHHHHQLLCFSALTTKQWCHATQPWTGQGAGVAGQMKGRRRLWYAADASLPLIRKRTGAGRGGGGGGGVTELWIRTVQTPVRKPRQWCRRWIETAVACEVEGNGRFAGGPF